MDLESLKYAKTHEWVSVEGDVATIGITDFAVTALTDLVYVDLPAVGSQATAGQIFGEVESVKAVSDLYSPVSGDVVEVNDGLADDLDALSEDAFGRGWMIRVKFSGTGQLEQLLDRSSYVQHCESESH
ncbi:MAG: glycine cleavage system protein GcvH [Planctomycetaceae bacterium]